jgi:hypothetical protein
MLIESKRWLIRLPKEEDALPLQKYYIDNKAFFKPWMPSYAPNRFNLDYVEASIMVYLDFYQKGQLLPLLISYQTQFLTSKIRR